MWVVPLTVLIWVYAEREQTDNIKNAPLRIEVKNTDPRWLIQLRDADGHVHPDLLVHADFSGPHARVEDVLQKLAAGSAVAMDVDTKRGTGIHSISLSMLSNDPLFVKSGVTVTTPMPREVEVSIEAMMQRDVEVKPDPKATNIDVNATSFEPRKVRVTGPESLLKNASLVAYAQIPPQKEQGVHEIPGVEVVLPLSDPHMPLSDPHVTISPPTVSARVKVKDPEIAGVVRAMPVWEELPPGKVWDNFKAEHELTIADVKVRGPADKVDHVNDGNFAPKPLARINLGAADPPIGDHPVVGQRYTAPLEIVFSNSGLRLDPEDTHKTLSFTVVERKPTE
jgi:hypothetical protein